MKKLVSILVAAVVALGLMSATAKAVIIQPDSVTTDTVNDHFSIGNLVNGNGLTNDDPPEHLYNWVNWPHTYNNLWVTQEVSWAENYFDYYGPVHLVFDLGKDTDVGTIYIWPYAFGTRYQSPNTYQANTLRDFQLRFNTEAQGLVFSGAADFTAAADHGPALANGVPILTDTVPRQDILFDTIFQARYIEMTITSNYFGFAGGAGGDRCGGSEIWFDTTIIPEPAALSIFALGALSITRKRK